MSDRKLVVFDFDGTLVDSERHFAEALAEFSIARSLPYDANKMKLGYVEPSKNDLGWEILMDQQTAMLAEYGSYIEKEILEKKRFMPDMFENVIETLQLLQEEYDLALVTVRDRPTTLATLEYHNMKRFFPVYRTHCCAKERGYPIKPEPDALLCLLNELNYDVKNVVMIGDTNSDIQMAHAAGAKSIAVVWGMHPSERLQAANPNLFVHSVKELPQAIAQVFSL